MKTVESASNTEPWSTDDIVGCREVFSNLPPFATIIVVDDNEGGFVSQIRAPTLATGLRLLCVQSVSHQGTGPPPPEMPVELAGRTIMNGSVDAVCLCGDSSLLSPSTFSQWKRKLRPGGWLIGRGCRTAEARRIVSASLGQPDWEWANSFASRCFPDKHGARTLVGLLSCRRYVDRRFACLETWAGDLLLRSNIDLVAVVGSSDHDAVVRKGHYLLVPCDDGYDCHVQKVTALCQWALGNTSWEHLFKCDDDTYLHPNRFAVFAPRDDYVGWDIGGYASGGAGYALSRRAVQIVATLQARGGYEDCEVGKLLGQHGIHLSHEERLYPRNDQWPTEANQLLSSHYISPQQMRSIHHDVTRPPKGTIGPAAGCDHGEGGPSSPTSLQDVPGAPHAGTTETIVEILSRHATDKDTCHSYGPIYEELLAPFRHTARFVLELGISAAGSLLAFRDYFTAAHIRGMDAGEAPCVEGDRISLCRGDHRDLQDLERACTLNGARITFDVIIDDGSHDIDAQLLSLFHLWPSLRSGGIYVIEDVQRSQDHARFSVFPQAELIDLRHFKGRADDMLVVLRKP